MVSLPGSVAVLAELYASSRGGLVPWSDLVTHRDVPSSVVRGLKRQAEAKGPSDHLGDRDRIRDRIRAVA